MKMRTMKRNEMNGKNVMMTMTSGMTKRLTWRQKRHCCSEMNSIDFSDC